MLKCNHIESILPPLADPVAPRRRPTSEKKNDQLREDFAPLHGRRTRRRQTSEEKKRPRREDIAPCAANHTPPLADLRGK